MKNTNYKSSLHATKAWARARGWTGNAGWVYAPAWLIPAWMPTLSDGSRASCVNGYVALEIKLVDAAEILPVDPANLDGAWRLNLTKFEEVYHLVVGKTPVCQMPYDVLCSGILEELLGEAEKLQEQTKGAIRLVPGCCPVGCSGML